MITEKAIEKAIKAYNKVDGGLTLYPDAMRNALEIVAPVWQTIETAPKDGTKFLGCWFNPFSQGWIIQPMLYYKGSWKIQWDGDEDITPTHWMPMPESPL